MIATLRTSRQREGSGAESPGHLAPHLWRSLRRWWLAHGGNTPNWDLAGACTLEERRGLLLVEAKVNVPELSAGGKRLVGSRRKKDGSPLKPPSERAKLNDARIRQAVAEAGRALAILEVGKPFTANSHYQLANRLAVAWNWRPRRISHAPIFGLLRGSRNRASRRSLSVRGALVLSIPGSYFHLLNCEGAFPPSPAESVCFPRGLPTLLPTFREPARHPPGGRRSLRRSWMLSRTTRAHGLMWKRTCSCTAPGRRVSSPV
jgi:hypothetical protein